MKNALQTILIIITVGVGIDLFLNGGQVMAMLAGGSNTVEPLFIDTAVQGQPLQNTIILVATSTPLPPAAPPAVETLVTVEPAIQPGFAEATTTAYFAEPPTVEPPTPQPPENIIVLGAAEEPTQAFSITDEKLAACLQAQMEGRRLAPYCPPNPAEYAGTGR